MKTGRDERLTQADWEELASALRRAAESVQVKAPAASISTTSLGERARILYVQRRARDRLFGDGRSIFGEPAWDILLDLFIIGEAGGSISVSAVCIGAAVAPTTALRVIDKLCDMRLIDRTPDPLDRRRVYVSLSDEGRDIMAEYLTSLP